MIPFATLLVAAVHRDRDAHETPAYMLQHMEKEYPMKSLKIMFSATALAAALCASTSVFADDADAGNIRHLMMARFDTPEARLTVEPVTIHKNIAVTGWAQGDVGGRMLLRRLGGEWRLVLSSGDMLKETKLLQQFGLDAEEAEEMIKAVADAETKLDPALVAKFSTSRSIMMMGGTGDHPPVDGHGHDGRKKS